MRGTLATVAAVALLSGCSGSSAPSTEPLSSPTPAGNGGAPPISAAGERRIAVYIALLEEHLFIEPGLFDTAYIDPRPGRDGEPLSSRVQDAISDHFLPRMDVRWGDRADASTVADADFVTLPVLPDGRDAFRVVVSDTCGNVCGHGQRYRVTRQGDGWKATPVGGMAIS